MKLLYRIREYSRDKINYTEFEKAYRWPGSMQWTHY